MNGYATKCNIILLLHFCLIYKLEFHDFFSTLLFSPKYKKKIIIINGPETNYFLLFLAICFVKHV